ncbi:MAG: 4-hydroxy-3-methylbut-2-enyl diphosphate reductase [Deltaproteobacteria bacterium]|nr:4-hydroxy-3-methylbut-2-enyl diphosphate reductase [Deltaproteobacteria bacterium]
MRVRLAKTAGFCMGVRRAMELALSEANKSDGPLYTYGPLIHNEQVLDLLESKGVRSVTDLETLRDSARGRIIIRAHGIPPATRKALRASPLEVIDGTCPRVARVQAIIRYYTSKGHTALIVGDPEHAEVVGLVGYAKTSAYVIRHEDEVAGLPELDRVILVAQTTQDEKKYGQVTRKVKERFPDARVFQTICEATRQRQEEVRLLAESVDAVVVVGGYHSGNTQRLAQIARSQGVPTFHVETEKELDKATLARMELIGVTAGASTLDDQKRGEGDRGNPGFPRPSLVALGPEGLQVRRAQQLSRGRGGILPGPDRCRTFREDRRRPIPLSHVSLYLCHERP